MYLNHFSTRYITALNTFSAQGSLDDPGLAPGGVDHLLLGLPEAWADEAGYSIIIPDIVLLYLMRGVDTQKLKERRSGNTVMTGSISSIRLLSFFPRLACFMPGNRG